MTWLVRVATRTWRVLRFAAWYSGQLVASNVAVARLVLSPRPRPVPGIVRVPLRSGREGHVALLAGLVTLTPGTLVLATQVSPPVMYVHGLHAPDADALRREVQEMEERMLAAVSLAVGEVPC